MIWQLEVWPDVLGRYAEAIRANAGWVALALTCGAAYAWKGRDAEAWWNRATRLPRYAIWTALGLAALAWTWHLRWLSDDAFISFRYAQNWMHGNGLVFNPGERVEGYTNFLWTALVALPIPIGIAPEEASVILCMASLVAALAAVALIARRLGGGLPIAAVLLGANYTFACFGTSGLETMFATALVWWSVERALAESPLSAGVLGVAGAMARPDHAVFYLALIGAMALDPGQRKHLVRFAIPLLAVYAPYFVCRWRYYGAFLPNTFYAKSATGSYFEQGFLYAYTFFIGSGAWAALPAAAVGWIVLRGNLLGRFLAIGLPVYAYYVMKIGGDFMYGRFWVVALPGLLLVAQIGMRRLAVLAVLAFLVAVPTRILHPSELRWYLADAATFYHLTSFHPVSMQSGEFTYGKVLGRHLKQSGATLSSGSIGMIGYYGGMRMVDESGLTETGLAHEPLLRRGRPGHERKASMEYRLSRGAEVFIDQVWPTPYAPLATVWIEGRPIYLHHYVPALVAQLTSDNQVAFVDFPRFLDEYATKVRALPKTVAERDLDFFDRFYFSWVADPDRRTRVVQGKKAPSAAHAPAPASPRAAQPAPPGLIQEAAAPRVETWGDRNTLGNEYFKRGDFGRAIIEYRQAIALQPDQAGSYNNLGSAYFQSGNAGKAIAAYEAALALNPGLDDALRNLVIARQSAGLR